MPWSEKQHRLFCAAAGNPEVARRLKLSRKKAKEMCHEGVRKVGEALARKRGEGK